MIRRALSTLNLSLDLNLFSLSNVYWECYKLIYIYFFFQEINDSLKSLLFYPVHFNLLIDDLIKIEFSLRVNLNSSLRKYCRQFLHTYKDSQPTPVGRPIMWGCSGPKERISAFVDRLIQPITQRQDSYLKDTTDFLNFIDSTKLPKNTVLVSMDVTSLFNK